MNSKRNNIPIFKRQAKLILRRPIVLSLLFLSLTSALYLPNFVVISNAAYPDYNTFIELCKNLANAYPSYVSYETIGKTVQGRNILMFKIGNPNGGRILIDGAMHGCENLGSELLYFFADWLLSSNDPLASRILTRNYILVIPALNADEYGKWRKNANGVDLNRNFATNWESAGSTDPSSEYYHGPAPLSEPESKALVQVFQKSKPKFYINLHQGSSILYGSTYCNSEYYSMLYSKIIQLANQRGVPYYSFQSIRGNGYALSDAAKTGIVSFLLEIDWISLSLTDIKTKILPKFIPIVAVLGQECETKEIFKDGFESGNLNNWSGQIVTSGGSASVSTSNPYIGTYSARFTSIATNSGTIRACVYRKINDSPTIYARVYLYIEQGLPLLDDNDRFTPIQFLNSQGGILANLQIRHINGEDRFAVLAFNKLVTTTKVYPKLITWYCLELYVRIDPIQGQVKAFINGIECLSLTNLDTSIWGQVSIVRFGLANSINIQKKVVIYLDSAAISNGYIGQIK